jgi:two-component system sensor histidine kinase YesM
VERGKLFRIHSIQTKIFFGLMMVTVLSISLVMVYMYQKSADSIKRNAIEYASDGLKHSEEKLGYLIRDIERVITVVSLDQEYVAAALESENSFPSLEWFQENKRVGSFLQSLKGYNTYIDRIGVVGLENRKLFQSGLLQNIELQEDTWSRRLLNTEPNRGRLYAEYRNSKVSVGKIIFAHGERLGYTVMDINQDILASTFYSQPTNNMQLFVVSSDGTIIHHHEDILVGQSIQSTGYRSFWAEGSQQEEMAGKEVASGGKTYLQLNRKIPELEWTIVAVISESDLIKDAVIVRNEMLRILLIVGLLVLIASVVLAKQITRNLKSLLQAMEQVKHGNFNARTDISAYDEAGQLGATFNMMMQRIRDLMKDVEVRERQKRDADFKALQSQIHPHFVYNTLNTIRYLANIQQTPNIEELTSSFITLLRAITSHQQEQITVKEELELLRHYLTIQQYRFAGRLQYTLTSDPKCHSCNILKFTLQPIVENAVLHGIGPKDDGGTIHVDIFCEEDDLVCVVHDNGVGMTELQINQALQNEDRNEKASLRVGVGMRNVNDRIKIYYGENYGIKIYSDLGHSTTIEVRQPWTVKTEWNEEEPKP